MNDATCARLMAVIADGAAPFVTVDNVMVPTELGAVPEWSDSQRLEFYFAWCAGLTGQAAEAYSRALASPSWLLSGPRPMLVSEPTPTAGPPMPNLLRLLPSKRHSPGVCWGPMPGRCRVS